MMRESEFHVSPRSPRGASRQKATRAIAGALSAVLAVSLGGFATQSASAALPDDSLILHYDFEDTTLAASVPDRSPGGLNGTLVNIANASVVDGEAAGSHALSLSGGAWNSTGPYVSLPTALLAGRTDLTVSTRIKWEGSPAEWQWIYGLGTNTTQYLFSTPRTNTGFMRTAITTNGPGAEAQVSGSAALPPSEWATITITLDTATDTLTFYLNGAATGSVTTTITAAQLLAGTPARAGFIGKSFYNDPLFAGAIDDFRAYNVALTAEQVAELAGGLPEATSLAQTSVDLNTYTGEAPALPATVLAHFDDNFDRPVPVTWNAVDPSQYATKGTFDVSGTALAANDVTAHVTVIRPGELRVDLATDTGAFHGGASGTLYGLYGEGIPSDNLIEGINLRTVSTKAQDGPQHPGADALEVVQPLADATDGDVYIYMTDINRGFPYEWPGSTPAEKLNGFLAKIQTQVEQVLELDAAYQDNIVFVPFNEPEGNMFGTGQWSYNGVSWLNDPDDYFMAWDAAYEIIKSRIPDARIAGPNTSVLYNQVKGFLQHTINAGTVPEVMTWHELSHPAAIRASVIKYRAWETELFAGTEYEPLPININEYAFNYHTSVPGQMIQWVSAIEESKVDADIAYWNVDGNLSDSAVQANRGNGQWWLLNAYSQMSGHTVAVTPPLPNTNYTLQGVATLDESKAQARVLFGGSAGKAIISFENVDAEIFGTSVHAVVQEIGWTGQIGDSAEPAVVKEFEAPIVNGVVDFDFGDDLPELLEESAYQIVLTPGENSNANQVAPFTWRTTLEAEDAAHTGDGWSRNGIEGSPADVSKYFTSGGYNVGGLRAGSNVVLSFPVTVPETGTYDLSVFASSLNTYGLVQEQGPTNVFLQVDGGAEQEVFLPLGYKWVVWDHADTTVELTEGTHTLTLSASSLDGTKTTKGDAIIDKIDLALPNADAAVATYEAEYASMDGAALDYSRADVSGSGAAEIGAGESATFWVYSADDGESTISVDLLDGEAALSVNGIEIAALTGASDIPVFLSGGVNKVTLTGSADTAVLDRLRVADTDGTLVGERFEAEDAAVNGTATATPFSLASGGAAVTAVGGEPGNANTLTFTDVEVETAGTYALTVRYSNEEQSPATHYNPDPLARPADISINGEPSQRYLFPHSFHKNNFWELTIPVQLDAGVNTIEFSSEELPNFDGETYVSDVWPGVLLRSEYAPNIDWISVTPFTTPEVVAPVIAAEVSSADPETSGWLSAIPVTLGLTLTEGQADIEYRTNGGEWTQYGGPAAYSADGEFTVDYRAVVGGAPVEGAGGSVAFKIDATDPVTTATPTPADGKAKAGKSVAITFAASDAGSGLATTEYRVNGGEWASVPGGGLSFTQSGSYVVAYRSTDVAGNVEATKTVTVTIADKRGRSAVHGHGQH